MKVTYKDHMGSDLDVVNDARVSFGKESSWEIPPLRIDSGLKVWELKPEDKRLIQFLARGCTSSDWEKLTEEIFYKGVSSALDDFAVYPITEGEIKENKREMVELLNHVRKMQRHWTPFANGGTIKLHFKVPIFVARQLQKHQAGFEPQSEISRRYVTDEPEFYEPEMWRKAAENVKQGSSDEVVDLVWGPEHLYEKPLAVYKRMLECDVAPEIARMVLPQSMYTEYVWKGNLYAWASLYNTRSDAHAQREVQEVAKQIGEIIEPLFPESWKALTS